jgi:hypothetical protein
MAGGFFFTGFAGEILFENFYAEIFFRLRCGGNFLAGKKSRRIFFN